MQEEVDQKTIALAVKTGKLTAQVLQAAIRKYLAARQKGTGKAHHGQQSLRQLKKDGSALSNIEITDANIGLFNRTIYSGISSCVMQNVASISASAARMASSSCGVNGILTTPLVTRCTGRPLLL